MTDTRDTADLGAIARAALEELDASGRMVDHWRAPGLLNELRAIPDAGSWNDEDLYDFDTGEYVRGRLSVDCPHCGKRHRPLLSKSRATVEFGWRWVGLDHREPYSEQIARCAATGRWYRFTTYTPQ